MTVLTTLFHLLPHPSAARSRRDGRFVVTIEELFNPLVGLDNGSASSDCTVAKGSQLELSHLADTDEDLSFVRITPYSSKSNHVHFSCELEQIHEIPSHRDYTDSQWSELFVGCQELDDNARRNRIEFQFEGRDWRSVLEEDNFTLCADGRLYHPITVQIHLRNMEAQRVAFHNESHRLTATVNLKKRLLEADSDSETREAKKVRMTIMRSSQQRGRLMTATTRRRRSASCSGRLSSQ